MTDLSEIIRGAQTDLADHEARAREVAEKRFEAQVREYIERPELYKFGGIVNLISTIAAICESKSRDPFDDWDAAAEALQGVVLDVDRKYDECPELEDEDE